MDKRQIFRRELPKYMARAGMKQIDLAKALEMSKSTVHCWITGKAFPEIDTIKKIAVALGCTEDDLIVERKVLDIADLLSTAPQSFDQSLFPALKERLRPQTPEEDAKMVILWRSASIQAKRAAIAVLESMANEKLK